jgi:hypothetical protein
MLAEIFRPHFTHISHHTQYPIEPSMTSTISFLGRHRSEHCIDVPSLYPYVRPITISVRTSHHSTIRYRYRYYNIRYRYFNSIRTNESSTDSLSFLLRRRYLSLSNTPPEADYQCFPPDYGHSLVRSTQLFELTLRAHSASSL